MMNHVLQVSQLSPDAARAWIAGWKAGRDAMLQRAPRAGDEQRLLVDLQRKAVAETALLVGSSLRSAAEVDEQAVRAELQRRFQKRVATLVYEHALAPSAARAGAGSMVAAEMCVRVENDLVNLMARSADQAAARGFRHLDDYFDARTGLLKEDRGLLKRATEAVSGKAKDALRAQARAGREVSLDVAGGEGAAVAASLAAPPVPDPVEAADERRRILAAVRRAGVGGVDWSIFVLHAVFSMPYDLIVEQPAIRAAYAPRPRHRRHDAGAAADASARVDWAKQRYARTRRLLLAAVQEPAGP